jgi:exopolysaccharide biosynthesis polyprenyl glycosylphosphotransferase
VSPGEGSDTLAFQATAEASAPLVPAAVGADAHIGDRAEPARRRIRRGWLVRRMLAAADGIGLTTAFVATEYLFPPDRLTDHLDVSVETLIFVTSLPVWVVAAKLYGLYDHDEERARHSTVDELVSVFHLITVGVWLFYSTRWIVGFAQPDQMKLATFWFLALISVTAARSAARAIARRHSAYLQNTIIVGAGDVGQLIGRKILQHPEYGINLLGFVDGEPKERRQDLGELQLLGRPDDIRELIDKNDIDRVIVAFSRERHEQMLELVRALHRREIQVDVVPRLFEAVSPNVGIHAVEGLPLLGLPARRMPRSSRLLKRGFDVIGASILLAATGPLMVLIAFLIRRDSPGPVFFRQTRLGIDMREFTFFKFRTMREGTDEGPHREYLRQIMSADAAPTAKNLYKLERVDVVTRLGRWLRRTSLDELPQLLNVLRGDMSLVGPRPIIPYELELLEPHHFERFLVPAGITGLWQVEARAHSTFVEALDLDVAYARGCSLGLDVRLLLRTPLLMFRKRETG